MKQSATKYEYKQLIEFEKGNLLDVDARNYLIWETQGL